MKLRVVLLGLAAFLLALLVVLPARWVGGLLSPQLECAAWSGSIWRGQCAGLILQLPGSPPEPIELLRWKLHPAALLRLALQADFDVRAAQGVGSGQIELGRGGRIAMQDVSLSMQFDRRLVGMISPGWNGQLQGQQLAIRLQGKQVLALAGELQLRDFNDGRGVALGNYHLTFPPAASPPFVGVLQDKGGPLVVTASLTVNADRSWLLEGTVAAGPGAPQALQRRLDILGPPDAEGRRRLAAEGTFR
jgi:general secretion pathway protein N